MVVVFPYLVDSVGEKRYILEIDRDNGTFIIPLFSVDTNDKTKLARHLLQRIFGVANELAVSECAKRLRLANNVYELEMHQIDFKVIDPNVANRMILLNEPIYKSLLAHIAKGAKNVILKLRDKRLSAKITQREEA